jgi:REP element-mobilizing transposase RayT
MSFYRRRLPHLDVPGQPTFITWRLHGSLPPNRAFPKKTVASGRAFVAVDRLLDAGTSGPLYLRQAEIAEMVVEALQHNAAVLGHYELHAYVVMPNHVHVLCTPRISVRLLTKSLKGITAKRANERMALTGDPFWAEESYDHVVRHGQFERIRHYIEQNPVQAGLAVSARDFRWSSAWPARGPAADQGSALHNQYAILLKYQNEIKRRQGALPLEWHWRLKQSGRFFPQISATSPIPGRQKYRLLS